MTEKKIVLIVLSVVLFIVAIIQTVEYAKVGYQGPITYLIPMYYIMALTLGLLAIFNKNIKVTLAVGCGVFIILFSIFVLIMYLMGKGWRN